MKSKVIVWISNYWERLLFGITGGILLVFSFKSLAAENVALATASFAMSFLSFIYSNVSRFKRFKGLGFEAELWEDKQKEAAELIDRLKRLISIYSHEVLMQKVTQGRWGGGADWKARWDLFRELTTEHSALGQNIDFSGTKKAMDIYFFFDIVMKFANGVANPIQAAKAKASEIIDKEFGSPIKDAVGFQARMSQLHKVKTHLEDPFTIAQKGNLASALLNLATEAAEHLKKDFDLEIGFQQPALDQLQSLSNLYTKGPIEVTDSLLELSKSD
jgi:hypothetical protein